MWYAIHGGPAESTGVERYVVSTPGTRRIVNSPEHVGVEFNRTLETSMVSALRDAPFKSLMLDHSETQSCVVNFLRGGLNFELRRALNEAYGFNKHASVFLSSQRFKKDGQWYIRENTYRKLDIPDDPVLIVGDVVATGVTLTHGFDVLLRHLESTGSGLRGLVLFTIGCPRAEEVLVAFDAAARKLFPGYERTVLVYLEGAFHLVEEESPLRIGLPGTDLVRRDALLSPELVRSFYEDVAASLERCAIYDAGSRAFDIPSYLDDVTEYWNQVMALGRSGITLLQTLHERWPASELDRSALAEQFEEWWPGLELTEVNHLLDLADKGWGELAALDTAEALIDLCHRRIKAISN